MCMAVAQLVLLNVGAQGRTHRGMGGPSICFDMSSMKQSYCFAVGWVSKVGEKGKSVEREGWVLSCLSTSSSLALR